jgi:hypothetical protein
MTKLFFRWLAKKCRDSMENVNHVEAEPMYSTASLQPKRFMREGLNFTIYTAESGGFVIECVTRDPRSGEPKSRLHLINDSSELNEKLPHIVTVETLRA